MKCVEIDARGLEPPEPLVRILGALEPLAAGDKLTARTDRRPIHLLDAVAGRGCAAHCEESSDAGYITTIVKR